MKKILVLLVFQLVFTGMTQSQNWNSIGYTHDLNSPYPYNYFLLLDMNGFNGDISAEFEIMVLADENYMYHSRSSIFVSRWGGSPSGRLDGVSLNYISGKPGMLEVLVKDNQIWIRSTQKWGSLKYRIIDHLNHGSWLTPLTTQTTVPTGVVASSSQPFYYDFDSSKMNYLPTLTASGDVGIGTTSPAAKLHIQAGDTNFSWTPIAGTTAIFENTNVNRSFVSIIGKSSAQSELWFGDETAQNSGRVRYDHTINTLSLWNGGGQKVSLTEAGNLGVGVSSPESPLHVKHSQGTKYGIKIQSNSYTDNSKALIEFATSGSSNVHGAYIGAIRVPQGSGKSDIIFGTNSNGDLTSDNIEERMRIANNGNVGIGTDNPDTKLTVAGKIHAQEVKVTVAAGSVPDYVFNKEYHLKSLEAVEAHINKEGHLPNIPSAKDLEYHGLKLKEMNLKLLEKIEELMLYTIAQDKELKEKDVKINLLSNKLNSLEILITEIQSKLKTK